MKLVTYLHVISEGEGERKPEEEREREEVWKREGERLILRLRGANNNARFNGLEIIATKLVPDSG